MLPTIHLNGTSAAELQNQAAAVMDPDAGRTLVTGDYDMARRDAYSHTPTAGFLCRHGEEV